MNEEKKETCKECDQEPKWRCNACHYPFCEDHMNSAANLCKKCDEHLSKPETIAKIGGVYYPNRRLPYRVFGNPTTKQ